MKRYAAHYIYLSPEKIYKLHVIELNEDGTIRQLFPLTVEIESTIFINGTLVVCPKDISSTIIQDIKTLEELSKLTPLDFKKPVDLYQFEEGLKKIVL